ncbi:TolC family outer membrane protein [Salidesulfovibrio brasiliensis]|uniref:TolC family outer membrane protein n=1 Tax=Salidesulfovibrio brasiliensis TaxID=221711 RepID=UPI0006D15C1A|nr:TolC family outer membrane protein [Salidesulfovibrio brasiliensis]
MKRAILSILLIFMFAVTAQAGADGTTSLKESVVTSVKHHPKIKSILYNREASARDLSAALGRFFPSLDVSANYGFQQYDSSTTRRLGTDQRTRTASDTTVALSLNLFDGMDRYYTYQGFKDRLQSAEYLLMDNVEAIALDAVRAHHDVVRERKLLELAENNVQDHRDLLDSISERVFAGATSRADETQAMSRLARAETTHITYQGNLNNAEAAYRRMTGTEPGALSKPEFHPDYIEGELRELLDRTLENNPKIKVRKADLAASEKDQNVTESDYYPNVDVVVSSRNTDRLDGATTHLQDNRAMLEMSWNLFSGGTDYNEAKAAESRVNEAQAELQDTIDELSREVATAWSDYEIAVKQVANYEKALDYSKETRDMYLVQFNVGQRSLLDVLDSINEVFSNSVLLETARMNRSFSVYKLLTLEGELVQQLEVSDKAYEMAEK